MALATLSIDLVAQLANLQQGMDKAGRLAEKQAADIEARYARLQAGAAAVGAALGGAISVAGLVAWFRATANGLDALNDLKDVTGASIENISALESVALATGTSMDTVSTALTKFNKILSEAKPGSSQAELLKSIGLEAEELRRIDPAEALLKTAQALDSFADNGKKGQFYMELFGKSAREVAPFLKDLAEKGQLNATVTAQQAEEAEKFNKQLYEMQRHSVETARAIAGSLLPAINGMFDSFKSGGFAQLLGISDVKVGVDQAVAAYRLIGLARERITPLQILERNPGNAEALAELARIDKQAKEVAESLKSARSNYLKIGESQAGAGRGFINPPMVKPSVPDLPAKADKPTVEKEKIDEATRALAAYVEQLQRGIEKTDDLSERQKGLDLLRSIGVKGEIPQVRELVLGLADELDKRKQGLEFAKAMTAEIERQKTAQAGLDTELARFAGRLDDARKIDLTTRLEDRLKAGDVFSPEELDRIVKGIAGIKDQVAEMDEFTKTFAQSVQTNLGDTLRLSLSGDFESIAKLWGNMLLRMASEAIAADLTRALFPGFKGSDASSTASLGGLISGFFGGFGSGGRALGGPVRAGGMYEVNEGGAPELLTVGNRNMLLMGKQAGQVTPATGAAPGAGAAGTGISVVNNIAAGVQRPEMMAALQLGMASVLQTIRGEIRQQARA